MQLKSIKYEDILPKGSKVIHKTTLEVGEVVGDCLGFGKVRVIYNTSKMWYPQPKNNIMLIVK